MTDAADRVRAEYARRARELAEEDHYAYTAPEWLLTGQELERLAIDALRAAGRLPLRERDVLDVGCGAGRWLARLESWGADPARLAGLDLVPDRVARAAARFPAADVREGDATALPWADGSFDVVLHSMMLSSITEPAVRAAAAREMARVLRPDGVVLWYDFFVAHPRNPHVKGVGRRELRALFPGFEPALRRTTLAPPLSRRVARRSRPLAVALSALRVLDTHYVGTLRKPRSAAA